MSNENKKLIKCSSCGADIAKSAKVCPQCGSKNKKPFYKKWWFIAIILIVIIGAVAGGGGDTTETGNVSNNDGATPELKEYVVYEVNQLIDDLESNALSAKEKYENQYVEITGKMTVIDSDGSYISLYPTNNDFSLTSVQCFIKNDEQRSQVAQLSKGDIVTVKGKIKSVGELLGYSLDIDEIK